MIKPKMKRRPEVRRSVGRGLWNLFSLLPMWVRGPIIRRLFEVESDLPDNLIFKKAETYEELEQAFEVAFDAYRERDLVTDSDTRMRVTKYHALPTTTILIAKLDEEVIATISIIRDSTWGLPLEQLFDIDFLRKDSKIIAEISTLAIKRGHRSQRGKLLLALCKFMNHYCLEYLGVETIVATVHPEVSDFYRCVLMFEDIEGGRPKNYSFVKGAAASAHFLRIKGIAPKAFEKAFKHLPDNKNVFKFLYQQEIPNFKFPERKFFSSTEFTFTPEWFQSFFKLRTNVLNSLSEDEKYALSNLYYYPEYRTLFGSDEPIKRTRARFSTHCPVRFHFLENRQIFSGTAIEVSRAGMKISFDDAPDIQGTKEIFIAVEVAENRRVFFSGQTVWVDKKTKRCGIWINGFASKAWHDFLDYLEAELQSRAQVQSGKQFRAG